VKLSQCARRPCASKPIGFSSVRTRWYDVAAAHRELDSHPEVWQFDPGAPLSLERRRQTVERRISAYGGRIFGGLAVIRRDTGRFIGYCGLQLYLCDRGTRSTAEVELFYKLGRRHWGTRLRAGSLPRTGSTRVRRAEAGTHRDLHGCRE
jgi:hypothetical protein